MFLQIEFPGERDKLAAIIGTKNAKFSAGLTFNFHVPSSEGFEHVAFLVEIINPRVARAVVGKGDEVKFSTK